MNEQVSHGIELFNRGEYFRCHEVLEDAWRHERGSPRQFLQALIHIAVGLYHYERGNRIGASGQLRKGARKLEGYEPDYEGIDASRLRRDAIVAGESIDAGVPLSALPRIQLL
jgi:predicted metal-dependent hydrolase